MKTIAVANQKGGCGKTTTAINLSSSLCLKGKRVLLVDCDPQSHATLGLNVDTFETGSLYNVLTLRKEERLAVEDVIVSVKPDLDLMPSDPLLSAIEQEFADLDGRESRLVRILQPLSQAYDFVVLDCPPSIGHLCFNALRACDTAIIPIDMSLFSLRGVARLTDIVDMLGKALGHKIDCRALITMYDGRTRYARQVLAKVREQFGANVFETVIRYNIRLRETVDYGLPVSDYDHRAIGHCDYQRLAEELLLCAGAGQGRPLARSVRNYITSVSGHAEAPVTDSDEDLFAKAGASTYTQMVDDMVTTFPDIFEEYDDEVEQY